MVNLPIALQSYTAKLQSQFHIQLHLLSVSTVLAAQAIHSFCSCTRQDLFFLSPSNVRRLSDRASHYTLTRASVISQVKGHSICAFTREWVECRFHLRQRCTLEEGALERHIKAARLPLSRRNRCRLCYSSGERPPFIIITRSLARSLRNKWWWEKRK